jgi:hypothetical protein
MCIPGSLSWRAGNPAGRLRGSRNKLTEAVICALLRDFSKHGEKAIADVRRTQPAAYLKVLALLVPREHKLEHTNPVSRLSDEELVAMVEHLEGRIARRAAGSDAKLIEAVETTALPAPVEVPKPKRRNRVMAAADTTVLGHGET